MICFELSNSQSLTVASRREVEGMRDMKQSVLVSISDPDCEGILNKKVFRDVIEVQFHDLDEPLKQYRICTTKDAQRIAEFVLKYRDVPIICQCEAGISRSSGCAAAIMKFLTGDDMPIFTSPIFIPNTLVYRLVLRELIKMNEK